MLYLAIDYAQYSSTTDSNFARDGRVILVRADIERVLGLIGERENSYVSIAGCWKVAPCWFTSEISRSRCTNVAKMGQWFAAHCSRNLNVSLRY